MTGTWRNVLIWTAWMVLLLRRFPRALPLTPNPGFTLFTMSDFDNPVTTACGAFDGNGSFDFDYFIMMSPMMALHETSNVE